MVDNYDLIRQQLEFPTDDVFYFLQIIRRRKENPGQSKNEHHLGSYYISSIEQFDRVAKEVYTICEANNARAYFHLNKRSFKRVGLETMRILTDYIIQEQYKSIKSAYDSACGKYRTDENKKWLLDFDYKLDGDEWLNELQEFLLELEPVKVDKVLFTVPTKNGVHVITRPFNPQKFKEQYPDVEVMKNNPTILYSP